MRMFILCACNDEPRRAFVPCIPLQPFLIIAAVSIICAVQFSHVLPILPFTAAFMRFHVCPLPFAVRLPKRFQGSFHAVLEPF